MRIRGLAVVALLAAAIEAVSVSSFTQLDAELDAEFGFGGFMDKVKAKADEATQKAQEARDKADEMKK